MHQRKGHIWKIGRPRRETANSRSEPDLACNVRERSMPQIEPGDIVQSSRWPEPVEIKLVEDSGAYVHIVGQMIVSGRHVDQMLPI
ncbi:MAG: hypothetical protein Kow0047_31670 [Anaerolineae bacterium]